MRVSEIFYSLQGEGMLVGTPSVFVRLAGCPFRCRWCDTAYAWDYAAGEDLDPDQIVAQVRPVALRICRFDRRRADDRPGPVPPGRDWRI